MAEERSTPEGRRTGAVVFGAAALTILVYLLPAHGFIGRPLVWLSTLVHELGHGITGWLSGGSFTSFELFYDGSGVAHTRGDHRALICAGGLLGPAIVAAVGFVLARRARVAQGALLAGAASLLILAILVAGNWLAWLYMPGLAAIMIWIGARKNPAPSQIALVFLATQLALSVFSRGDYLFTAEATTGAGTLPSDVSHIATALGGPYWMWGLLIGLFSVVVLVGGLWLFTRAYPQLPARWRRGARRARRDRRSR